MTTKPISNTLETDALVLTHYDEYGVYKTNTTPYEDLQILARKLERERDELKRELEKLREYFKTLPTLKPEP